MHPERNACSHAACYRACLFEHLRWALPGNLVQTRTSKKREFMPKSNQDTGPLRLEIAERAIVEIVVGRRLYAAAKKLLHGTWNLR